jgi:hypothetical protein
MTLILGGTVIVTAVLQYNDTEYDQRLEYVVAGIQRGLGFLLAAYTLLIAGSTGPDAEMHKYFLVLLCLTSWGLVAFRDSTNTAWERVTTSVAIPIFEGSLFALPMVAYAFKA